MRKTSRFVGNMDATVKTLDPSPDVHPKVAGFLQSNPGWIREKQNQCEVF